MLHTRMFQLNGTNTGGINRFRNKGIDILELCVSNFQINAPQHVDSLSHCFPVKSGIVIDIQIQILLQGRHRLLVSSPEISLVDFVVGSLGINL